MSVISEHALSLPMRGLENVQENYPSEPALAGNNRLQAVEAPAATMKGPRIR